MSATLPQLPADLPTDSEQADLEFEVSPSGLGVMPAPERDSESALSHQNGRALIGPENDSVPYPMRPFFGFYGGKWRDALKHYPAPRYSTIVEPFAGSAGYSIRHQKNAKVVLAEKDEVIFRVWKYLQRASPEEIRGIRDLRNGECVDDLEIEEDAKLLVGFWLNRAASRPRSRPSAWMRQGIRPGSFWGERVRNTIANQLHLIRNWEIRHCSYEELEFDGEATWFIDPPYQKQGKHYHHGANEIDYSQLASWCRNRRGQVIVCEQDGADWLPFTSLATTKTTRVGVRSQEVMWTNDVPDSNSEK